MPEDIQVDDLVRLRKLHPNIERPFKVPFFPLTVYTAGAACILIIAFVDWRALLFGAGVLALFSATRYAAPPLSRWIATRIKAQEPDKDRILIAAASPATILGTTLKSVPSPAGPPAR